MTQTLKRLTKANYLLIAVLACFMAGSPVFASLDSQIDQLQQQQEQQQSQVNATQGQLNTLQGQLNALSAQLSKLQGQIATTQAEIASTEQQIAAKEAELAAQKAQLDELIDVDYEQASEPTFEMILDSNTLSDFFNQQEYSDAIQSKIDAATAAVVASTNALKQQQQNLTTQDKSLQTQESQTSQAQEAQQQLVAATAGQESNYKALLNGTTTQLNGLYAERAALDSSAGVTINTSGSCQDYPANLCALPPDAEVYLPGITSTWFYNKECVTYVVWKRHNAGQSWQMGNAGDWSVNTQTPSVGDVAVWAINGAIGMPYGHVAYVIAVNPGVSITVSEFNWTPYAYDTRTIPWHSSAWPTKGFLQ